MSEGLHENVANSNNAAHSFRSSLGKRQRLSLKAWKCRPINASACLENDTDGLQNKQPCQASVAADVKVETIMGNKSTVQMSPISLSFTTDMTLEDHCNSNLSVICTLTNLGNTCYLNSILYALRYMKEFRKSLHDLCCRIQAISSLFRSMHDVESEGQQTLDCIKMDNGMHIKNVPCSSLIPKKLLESMRKVNSVYEGNCQHDAHECFGFLLNCLEKGFQNYEQWLRELQSHKPTRRTTKAQTVSGELVSCPGATFAGKSLIKTLCLECEMHSEVEENFRDVAVAFLPSFESSTDNGGNFARALHTNETLRDDEKFWCSFCLRPNEAHRSSQFVQLPPILVILLKPTVLSTTICGLYKSSSHPLALPEILPCLLESCEKPCIEQAHRFYLSAIVCHIGASLSSGHYTSYVKSSNAEVPISRSNQSSSQQEEQNRTTRYNNKNTCQEMHYKEDCHSSDASCCNPSAGNRWLHFNDERVAIVEVVPKFNSKNSNETPYLLFYQKIAEKELENS